MPEGSELTRDYPFGVVRHLFEARLDRGEAGARATLVRAQAAGLGRGLRRAGQRVQAREHLSTGLDLAHRCGAAGLESEIRGELVAAGGRPRRPARSGVDSLTPTELRVARRAAPNCGHHMPDYGHDLMFGTMLEPPAERAVDAVRLAELTEQLGLDLVSLADHPYWPERLDTVTLLAAIAARTNRVRILPNLANLPLRPPAMLARTATTLDLLSGGRFELGVATGAQQLWDAIVADGGPRRDAGESIEALDEAVQVIRALWKPGPAVRFDGRYYQLDGATPGPAPAHDIAIWVGAYQPRLLRLVGRIADGWVPSSPHLGPEHLPAANRIIDQSAAAAGRSPEAVRRVYNIAGDYTATGTGFLQGPSKVWVEQLTELTLTQGISVYILCRVESDTLIRHSQKRGPRRCASR